LDIEKLSILKKVLGGYYHSGEEVLFHCPKCKHHKKKMSVNLELNAFKCWICDYSSRGIHRLIRRYGDFKERREWEKIDDKIDLSSATALEDLFKTEEFEGETKDTISMPDSFKSLTGLYSKPTAIYPKKYLKSRNVSNEDVLTWKIGYCDAGEYSGRVIIPSFDADGDLNYFIARAYDGSWMKYKNPPASKDVVFNELFVDWENDLVIVEGAFDAIVAENSVPLLGSTLREDSKLFKKLVQHDTPIYMALDHDVQSKETRIIKKLLTYDFEVYRIDTSGYDDVGSMPRSVFKERKNSAQIMTQEQMLIIEALGI
jgi:DNA primase